MGFLTPLFLAAAATALIPVVLHLVRRMRAREVPFSSLMFLSATPIQRIRRRRLQDILLMLLRAAALALLALVFARPFLPQDQVPFVLERQQESVVILVDVSYSMQHEGRFEAALEAARTRLESGDEWALVAVNQGAEQLTELGRDRTIHQAALAALEPTFASTDFFPAFSLASDILQDARYASRTIVLVSDFQQTGFSPAMENLVLPENVSFEPIQIGAGSVENRYFTDFAATLHRRGERVAVHLDARVEPEGEVTLFLDGAETAQQNGPSVSFRPVTDRTGQVLGRLMVEDVQGQSDNEHFFSYTIQARPQILIVDRSDSQLTAFFLRSAFDLGESSQFRVSVRQTPSQLGGISLVIVANAATLGAGEVRTLLRFAEEGGAVVLAYADPGIPGAANLLGTAQATSIVRAHELQSAGAVIANVDAQHPVFELFAGGSILRPRIRQYMQVSPDSLSQVLAYFDTGDPFMIERATGQGRVLLFTTSLSTEWTDLPLTEVYVPLLYQVARYATERSGASPQYSVGEVVSLDGLPGETWTIAGPGGSVFTVEVDSAGLGHFRQTGLPGHYQASLGTTRSTFAVNIDPRESDLTSRDFEQAYAAVTYQPEETDLSVRLPEDQEQEQKLWRVILMIVLGLFVAESILASRR